MITKKNRKVLFLRKKISGENSIEELADVLIKGIPDLELILLPETGNTVSNIIENIKFARKNQGDINHIFSPSDSYLAPFLRKSKIVTWHDIQTGLMSKSFIKRWIRKNLLMIFPMFFVDYITCISENTKFELKRLNSSFEHKTSVIYNCYNPKIKYTPHVFNTNNPTILQIGTGNRKNLIRVIEALQGIKCSLYIIGKLNEEQIELLNVKGMSYVSEYDIDFERIIELYKQCDIVSFPSLYEGFGMPIIEANATGRVVLTSRMGAIPEIANDAAHFVNPYDVDDIRNGFSRLIVDQEYRELLIEKGKYNATRFTQSKMIQNYLDLYAKALK